MRNRDFTQLHELKALLGETPKPVEQLFQLADNRVVGAYQNAYLENIWAYAGIKAISTNIGGVPFCLRTTDRYGNPGPDVKDRLNPWQRLFDNPSPTVDKTQLWKITSLIYELEGQVFWILKKADGIRLCGEGEVPSIIEICGARHVTPLFQDWDTPVPQWTYARSGLQAVLQPWQFLRFFDVDPTNPSKGLSPTQVASLSIGVDQKVHSYNDKFFKNGAQISGYLVDENKDSDLSETEINSMLKRWNQQYNGMQNAHKTPFLSNGVKFVQTGSSQKDMDFLNLSKTLREEICGSLNVPKNQVGIFDGMNYANSKIADRQFFTNNLMPKMRYFASVVNTKLLYATEFQAYFDFSMIEPLKDDRDQRMRSAEVLFKLGYSLNEVNSVLELGMTEIDEEWASEPIEAARPEQGDEPDPSDPVMPAGQPEPDTAHEPSAGDEQPSSAKLPKKSLTDLLSMIFKGAPATAPIDEPTGMDGADFADLCVSPGAKTLRPKVVSFLTQLRNEQLKALGSDAPLLLTDVERLLFDKAAWQDRYRSVVRPVQRSVEASTLSFLGSEVETLGLVQLPAPEEWVRNASESVIARTFTVDNLWEYLRDTLKQAAERGESGAQVRELVREKFKAVLVLAPMISRTEVFKTANAVRFAVAQGLYGNELKKTWADSLDTEVRSLHAEYNKLGAQDLTFGYAEGLLFPGDPHAKSEDIVGCRCHITFSRVSQ